MSIHDEIEKWAHDNPGDAEVLVNAVAGGKAKAKPKESQANIIVEIALELFRFTRSSEGEPVAVALDRPSHAVLIRGDGLLKPVLAREYWKRMRRVAPASALGDAVATLEGLAMETVGTAAPLTVMEIGAEVTCVPAASVTTAVNA